MKGHFCGRTERIGLAETCLLCDRDGPNYEYLDPAVNQHPHNLSDKISFHKEIPKTWGKEIVWSNSPRYLGKFLHINAGKSTSIHYHKYKDEVITLISGEVEVQYFEKTNTDDYFCTMGIRLSDLVSARIKPFQRHRIVAITDCVVAEASTMYPSDSLRIYPVIK